MTAREIKNDISVKSRLVDMTDEQLNIIDFIIDYSFKDKEEVYTNGTILVPLFRVLDAIVQNGEQYQSDKQQYQSNKPLNQNKMRSRKEFKEDAILLAMQALITNGAGVSAKYIAKEAIKYGEELTHRLYGEELPIIKERRL